MTYKLGLKKVLGLMKQTGPKLITTSHEKFYKSKQPQTNYQSLNTVKKF